MPQSAVSPIPDDTPPDLVDLDALSPTAEIIPFPSCPIEDMPVYRSPLDRDAEGHYPTHLRSEYVGGLVTDLAEIERIRARVEYGDLPLWKRLITRAPEGWRH